MSLGALTLLRSVIALISISGLEAISTSKFTSIPAPNVENGFLNANRAQAITIESPSSLPPASIRQDPVKLLKNEDEVGYISDKYPVGGTIKFDIEQATKTSDFLPFERHERQRSFLHKRYNTELPEDDRSKSAQPIRRTRSIAYHGLHARGINSFTVMSAALPTLSSTAPVDEDGQDVSYFTTIRIGSRMKPFRVVIDTGSSDLWVPAADCISAACLNHGTFGPLDSDTYRRSTTPWKINYGSGSASGSLIADTLNLGGITTTSRIIFGTASQLADSFTSFPSDGILGLANSSASAQKVPNFMDNLAAMGLIARRLFAINLQRAQDIGVNRVSGQLSFGFVDTTKFCGQIVTTPNIAKSGLWEAKIDGIYINNVLLGLGALTGIIDTGTTLLLIPPAAATEIHRNIPGARADSTGSFTIPCSTTVPISMSFGGTQFFIDSRDYVGAPVDATNCVSNFVGQQFGGPQQVLIGDVFLKNVYSVFDLDNQEIGFGAKSLLHTSALM